MYSKKKINNACDKAIKNILAEGTTDVDIFNRPFELDFLKDTNKSITKNRIKDQVRKVIQTGEFRDSMVKLNGKMLLPKKTFSDFRICSWIDIYDEILYLTIALLIAPDIEKNKINIKKNIVHSYRYKKAEKKNAQIFNEKYNYTSFLRMTKKLELGKDNNIVVECDISNFYDRLNLHRLESTLLSYNTIPKKVITLLNELLLFWSNRDSYGIPVGSNASRILSEALLANIDQYLLSKKIPFVRFVDDYRLFANDTKHAHYNLSLLLEKLQLEGLFINSNKTKIRECKKDKELVMSVQSSIFSDLKKIEKISETDLEEIVKIRKIIAGYSGLIPLKFRTLSDKEKKKFKDFDLESAYNKMNTQVILIPEEIRDYFKAIVTKKEWDRFSESIFILNKLPQFIPYYIDIFAKNQEDFNDEQINLLKKEFQKLLREEESPEYILVSIIRFFSIERAFDKQIVLDFFYSLKRNSGHYIGRATLDILYGKLTRTDLLSLKNYYERADIWEKRAILNLLNEGLSLEEKIPFFKNISLTNNDLMIEHMTSKKTKYLKQIVT